MGLFQIGGKASPMNPKELFYPSIEEGDNSLEWDTDPNALNG